jgi:tetratricopeptide (TPR) repeat protein
MQLNPHDSYAVTTQNWLEVCVGRADTALMFLDLADRLDPHTPNVNWATREQALYRLRRYADALFVFERMAAREAWVDRYHAATLAQLGRHAAARSKSEEALKREPGEATHWTGRAMAKAAGISLRSVQRIWAAHGLKPHRVRTFKLSNDPKFAAKVQDVVGLYVDPPEHALVLSVDEKSQIQALDRTQPDLPMKKGRCGTMTHDYKRYDTTTLFAALDVLEGGSSANA